MLPSAAAPAAYRVQIEVWRRIGPEGPSRAAAALSESLFATIRAQILAKHPARPAREVTLAVIRRVYGVDVAVALEIMRTEPNR